MQCCAGAVQCCLGAALCCAVLGGAGCKFTEQDGTGSQRSTRRRGTVRIGVAQLEVPVQLVAALQHRTAPPASERRSIIRALCRMSDDGCRLAQCEVDGVELAPAERLHFERSSR